MRPFSDILGDSGYTPLSYPATPIQFHTFPDPRLQTGSHFRFIATSCATPNFPYVPLQGRRIRGFDLLAEYLWSANTTERVDSPLGNATSSNISRATSASTVPSPLGAQEPLGSEKAPTEFMLFLGDFIYADVPLYFGDDIESYRRLYRRNYQSDSFRKVYEHLRTLMMMHTAKQCY